MGLLDWLSGGADTPEMRAARELSLQRQADIVGALQSDGVPTHVRQRLQGARDGRLPWIATLTPAELLLVRSHGLRPVATVSATCWMHYGWSWTEGHAQGWLAALRRLREEARACGANAVLDVKMRSIALPKEESMDFTLVGTAVRVEGLQPSHEPVVATVPALEFVKLLEADVVPTGIAIGAHYEWMVDWRNRTDLRWMGNIECQPLTRLWESVRKRAHTSLRQSAAGQGNGVLAHVNFSQMFEREQGEQKSYLARHIVVATTVDARRGNPIPHDILFAVDMCAGKSPLRGGKPHHQSYASNDEEGVI